jgi:hypothetical protein
MIPKMIQTGKLSRTATAIPKQGLPSSASCSVSGSHTRHLLYPHDDCADAAAGWAPVMDLILVRPERMHEA